MFITLERVFDEIKVLREIVTGNGHPDTGMVVRQVKMEECQKLVVNDLTDIKESLKILHNDLSSHINDTSNRRHGKGEFLGVNVKAIETGWMWIVRAVIVIILTFMGWAGCNVPLLENIIKTAGK